MTLLAVVMEGTKRSEKLFGAACEMGLEGRTGDGGAGWEESGLSAK